MFEMSVGGHDILYARVVCMISVPVVGKLCEERKIEYE